MDLDSSNLFRVHFRRDKYPGHSAGQYREVTLEFFSQNGAGLGFLITDSKSDSREKFKIENCESLTPSKGSCAVTVAVATVGNVYLKFREKDEMKRFFDTFRKWMNSSNIHETAPDYPLPSAHPARRSPRLNRNECQAVDFSESHENFVEPDLPESNSNAKLSTQGALDWVFEMAPATEIPLACHEPSRKLLQQAISMRNPTRCTAAVADTRQPVRIVVDKENQHKTPVKTPRTAVHPTDSSEKRFPLTPKSEPVDAVADSTATSGLTPILSAVGHNGTLTPSKLKIPGLSNFPRRQEGNNQDLPLKRTASDSFDHDHDISKSKKTKGGESVLGFHHELDVSESKPQLKGFSNIGNTCYMNAILQALFGLDPFAKELHKSYQHFDESVPVDGLFASLALLLTVRNRDNTELKEDLLRNVKNAISSSAARFNGTAQHDAHEFLAQVLDQLKDEVGKMIAERPSSSTAVPNPVESNLEFSVCHSITCQNCHNLLCREEQFHALPLFLPKAQKASSQPSLQSLLDDYFKDELVSHKCESCGYDLALLSHKIKKLPRILILHLKRYEFIKETKSNAKVATAISLPRFLSLHRLCADNADKISLLSESTKKIVPAMPEETANQLCYGVRRQLYPDTKDAKLEPLERNKFSFRRYDGTRAYNTRSAAQGGRATYAGVDDNVDSDIEEALERSMRDTGPPTEFIDDEAEFLRQIEAAKQESMLLAGIICDSTNPDASVVDEESKVLGENGAEDEETRLNAEDGHLHPAFRLCGIVNHLGAGTGSGHYVSDVFNTESSTWHSFDDTSVTETTEEYVRKNRQRAGYIFFYMAKTLLDDAKSASTSH